MSVRGWPTTAVVCGTLVLLLGGCRGSSHPHPSAASVPASAAPPVGSVEHPRPVDCVDGRARGPAPAQGRPAPSIATSFSPPIGAGAGATGSGAPSGDAPGGGAPHTTRAPLVSGTAVPRIPATPAPDHDSEALRRSSITIGPLTWPAVRTLASGDQHAHGFQASGGWHYPVTTDIEPGQVVTVTVGAAERARAGLEFGGRLSQDSGTTPTPAVTFHGCPGRATAFAGAFFVAGDGRACVPLEVRVGDAPARRAVISFFNGTCPA